MIRLAVSRTPTWLTLAPGVRVQVRPVTTALVLAARHAAGIADGQLPEGEPPARVGERIATFAKTLARLAILSWDGIGDAEGRPLPVTPDAVEAVMDLYPLAEAFVAGYLAPLEALATEKKT